MKSNISSIYMYLQMHWHLDALLEARLRTQLVERKGEGGEHTDQIGHTLGML